MALPIEWVVKRPHPALVRRFEKQLFPEPIVQ